MPTTPDQPAAARRQPLAGSRHATTCLAWLALFAAAVVPLAPAAAQASAEPTFSFGAQGRLPGDGYAIVAATIGSEGRVLDALALEASGPEFAASAEAGVRTGRFAPAEVSTHPRREVLHFEFRLGGVVHTLSHYDAARGAFETTTNEPAIRTVQWSSLQDKPRRIAGAAPQLTGVAGAESGALIVSFVIDRSGQVRLPVMDRQVPAELADRILAVVAAWQYEPSTVNGTAVAVQAGRRFTTER